MVEHNNGGHRERLRARFSGTLGAGVADYELLELALTFAIPRKDVKPIAKDLMRTFGNLSNVMVATPDQLAQVKGLGPSSVVFIQVVQQLALRVRREKLVGQPVLASRLELMDYLYTKFAQCTREEFHVLYLDSKMKLLADEMLFAGTLHEVSTSPRDILKRALELNASGIIVAHNHPSGSPEPSVPDETFTMMLVQAAVALGVDVHDHVIVGAESHYSFKGGGKM
ncbi:MAG: DNA repair protein RadC [Blastochloris viridis]|uniref:DNA repair protein RadC n=1 Tax=Blastochloris viridis TaxID=1079 RepID=A0A6N4RBP3_BLAVI|nr:MAG: DNA repair protein RadC [Blastochloris viridis]